MAKPRARAALAIIHTEAGMALVTERINDLETSIAKLEAELEACRLERKALTELIPAKPRKRKRRRRSVGPKRVAAALRKLGRPALASELRGELGVGGARLRAILGQLVDAGEVTRSGRGRGTRYEVSS